MESACQVELRITSCIALVRAIAGGALVVAAMIGQIDPAEAQRQMRGRIQAIPSKPEVTPSLSIPKGTKIVVEISEATSSDGTEQGDTVTAIVAEPVSVQGVSIIPAGAIATGVISERKGKGAFGRSGKLEIEFKQVSFGENSVPVSGAFRREGKGRSAETAGAVVAAGVFAALIKGRNAIFEKGERLDLFTSETIVISNSLPTQRQ